MTEPRSLELLAPAADAATAREAILHGADAVYIGAPAFGARKAAANSIEDIRTVAEFAHIYRAKVYATVNTILYDHELRLAEKMAWQLYRAGVDALIVQDMALLRLELPPIALHASTQCDTRTPAKAKFLEEIGMSQIVLARELTLEEIREICREVRVPIECFVHGALCVSYSGRCHASVATTGRSANRGECAQICRLPFTLRDASGRILASDKHLLSLKDFNTIDRLPQLVEAGVSSFKIEGRLKETGYVKNVTAAYSRALDAIVDASGGTLRRSSFGRPEIGFRPQLDKSFNRGFTHYFLDERRPKDIWQPATPKSMGEEIRDISALHRGDGISFINEKGEYEGALVNGVEHGRLLTNKPIRLPKGVQLRRTSDIEWQRRMQRPSAERRLAVDITLGERYLKGVDERGVMAIVAHDATPQPAKNRQDLRGQLSKLGDTEFRLRNFRLTEGLETLSADWEGIFLPASRLADARRRLVSAMRCAAKATYRFDRRRAENPLARYPDRRLTYLDNVANRLAREFYESHGAETAEMALETKSREKIKADKRGADTGLSVMTTRHCILREMGLCLRESGKRSRKDEPQMPLTLSSGKMRFRLGFDCVRCEMHLLR